MHVMGPRAARSLLPELSRNGAKLLAVHWHWPRVLESLRPFSGHCDGGLPLTLKSKQTLNPQSSRLRFHARMKFLALPHIQPS